MNIFIYSFIFAKIGIPTGNSILTVPGSKTLAFVYHFVYFTFVSLLKSLCMYFPFSIVRILISVLPK
jgi:hypothetical protein